MNNANRIKNLNAKQEYQMSYTVKNMPCTNRNYMTPEKNIIANKDLNSSISSHNDNSILDCSNLPLGNLYINLFLLVSS